MKITINWLNIKKLERDIKVSIATECQIEVQPFIIRYKEDYICVIPSLNNPHVEEWLDNNIDLCTQLICEATGISWKYANENWILTGGIE